MTPFFPDLNVWLALSDNGHMHAGSAWQWHRKLPGDATLIFSRYTQLGLLRLLTNAAVMGEESWLLTTERFTASRGNTATLP